MNRREATLILVVCGIISACGTARYAFADKPETTLAAAARAAKAQLRPLTEADSQDAKKELVAAVNRLNERLGEDKDNGNGWKKFCQVEKLQQQLQLANGPDLSLLNQILHEKFLNGDVGLELVWFADVRHALRKYIETANAVGSPKWRTEYEQILDRLADDLDASARQRTPDAAFRINEAIARLSDARQTPELLAGLRSQLSHANLFAGEVGSGGSGHRRPDRRSRPDR